MAAVWNPGEGGVVQIPVAGDRAWRVNLMGERTPLAVEDGGVTLALRRGVVEYVVTGE